MNFSEAFKNLKQGKKIKRKGWNGQNQYVEHIKSDFCGDGFIITNKEKHTTNIWVPSPSDLFAEDWEIFKGE